MAELDQPTASFHWTTDVEEEPPGAYAYRLQLTTTIGERCS